MRQPVRPDLFPSQVRRRPGTDAGFQKISMEMRSLPRFREFFRGRRPSGSATHQQAMSLSDCPAHRRFWSRNLALGLSDQNSLKDLVFGGTRVCGRNGGNPWLIRPGLIVFGKFADSVKKNSATAESYATLGTILFLCRRLGCFQN